MYVLIHDWIHERIDLYSENLNHMCTSTFEGR